MPKGSIAHSFTVKHKFVPYLHCFVTAANVRLVDEDIRNSFLSSHLEQHLLVVGSIL